jgi:hypothetical protein
MYFVSSFINKPRRQVPWEVCLNKEQVLQLGLIHQRERTAVGFKKLKRERGQQK